MSEAYSANNRTIHLWAIGGMADYMLFVAFNALILPIYTTGFKLSPVLVGWALMLPRITDAILDPFIGHVSDNTHTRWGRRKPFLALTSVLGAVTAVLMWWAGREWAPWAQFTHLLICSIVLYFCYGTFSMTHVALGYELSDDYHVRTKVVAVRAFYFSIAAVGGGWMYWLALRPAFGNEITGIRILSLGIGAIILIAGLIPVFSCQERFVSSNRRHVKLWPAIRTTLQVRPFVILLLLRISQTLGLSLYGALSFHIGAYSVFGGDKRAFTLLPAIAGIAGVLCSFALVPLSAGISRKLGKRRGIIFGFAAAFLSSLLLPLFASPTWPYLLLVHMLVFIPTNAILAMFLAAVMPDICDIDELASGQRREGLFSAVMGFISKIENSLCMLIGGYMLAFSGFNANITQQPQDVLTRLRWLGFTPAIVFSGVALVFACFIPITQEMMREVQSRLAERRAAAASHSELATAVSQDTHTP